MKHSAEMDITHIKKQFPIFKNNELIYLDSAASAQKPLCVIESIKSLYSNHYSNINRGVYKLSQIVTDKYENSRDIVRNFLKVYSQQTAQHFF